MVCDLIMHHMIVFLQPNILSKALYLFVVLILQNVSGCSMLCSSTRSTETSLQSSRNTNRPRSSCRIQRSNCPNEWKVRFFLSLRSLYVFYDSFTTLFVLGQYPLDNIPRTISPDNIPRTISPGMVTPRILAFI